jgi:hypothetical protein
MGAGHLTDAKHPLGWLKSEFDTHTTARFTVSDLRFYTLIPSFSVYPKPKKAFTFKR